MNLLYLLKGLGIEHQDLIGLAAQEQNWLREIVQFLGHEQTEPTVVYEDNDAARLIAENDLGGGKGHWVGTQCHSECTDPEIRQWAL